MLCSLLAFAQACKKKSPETTTGPTAYSLEIPGNWPKPNILPENPLTVEGVALGRKLFYDKMLSGNGTQACADCHQQNAGFNDLEKKFSIGSEGDIGTRNSMPLFNLNWASGYFWDGRQPTLESLIQEPIQAHNEMNLKMEVALERLKADYAYPDLFLAAFPNNEITELTLSYAIAQFLRTITSANSPWDQAWAANPGKPEKAMTPAQFRGFRAFTDLDKGDCLHCHHPNTFFKGVNQFEFVNNGLDANPDSGYFKVTGKLDDFGKFKTPSLRNLALTAPYMHDGRFSTLKEVLNHYNTGFVHSATLDLNINKHFDADQNPIPRMTEQDMDDIIEFLLMLTDSTLITNPAFAKP